MRQVLVFPHARNVAAPPFHRQDQQQHQPTFADSFMLCTFFFTLHEQTIKEKRERERARHHNSIFIGPSSLSVHLHANTINERIYRQGQQASKQVVRRRGVLAAWRARHLPWPVAGAAPPLDVYCKSNDKRENEDNEGGGGGRRKRKEQQKQKQREGRSAREMKQANKKQKKKTWSNDWNCDICVLFFGVWGVSCHLPFVSRQRPTPSISRGSYCCCLYLSSLPPSLPHSLP